MILRIALAAIMVASIMGVVPLTGILPASAQAQASAATRSFNPATVAPGGTVTVTIQAANYGQAGGVTETLPAGFSYVSSSLSASQVDENGQNVRFTLQGDPSFTYTVTASSTPGPYDFSGTLRDFDKTDHTVVGTTRVTVQAPSTPTPSATRGFNPATVAPGGTVTVTIQAANYGQAGGVTETLPAGFSYVSSSLSASQVDENGQNVRFTLQGDPSFTYTVTASSTPGPYDFSGTLRDFDKTDHTVVGTTRVTVQAPSTPTPSATRGFNPATVAPGGTVTVTIQAANYGQAGGVTETLPAGFSYVSSSLSASQVDENGQNVRFTLQGDPSFTYTVTASSTPGPYDFSGTLRDFDKTDHTVVGTTRVTVQAPSTPTPSATRGFNPATVAPGGTVTVTIQAANYGQAGGVTETLPAGFSYVSSSLSASQVDENGQNVRFTLQGDPSFTYTVTASSTPGPYDFSGTLRDFDKTDHTVGGATSVRVRRPSSGGGGGGGGGGTPANRAPVFSEGASATRSVAENSAAGTAVGRRVTATDPDGNRVTYSLVGGDTELFNIDSATGQISVAQGTSLDFEAKDSYTVSVRAGDPSGSRDTISMTINVTNVDEDGMVTITPDTTPQVGTELTASLEDPDGSVANLTWQWQKDDGQGSYTDIPGATMMSYTPVMADEDSRLQATAMYADNHGASKTAMGMTGSAVGATPTTGGVLATYDADNSGDIQKPEYLEALTDYFLDDIEKDTYLNVLALYIASP